MLCARDGETDKPKENAPACARQHVKDNDVRQSVNVGQLVS